MRRRTCAESLFGPVNSPVDFAKIDDELRRAQELLLFNIQQASAGDALLSAEDDRLATISNTGCDSSSIRPEGYWENGGGRGGNHDDDDASGHKIPPRSAEDVAITSRATNSPANASADAYALLEQMGSDLNAVIDSKVAAERRTTVLVNKQKRSLDEYSSYVGALEAHIKLLTVTLRNSKSKNSGGITYNKISELLIDRVLDNIERTMLTSPNGANGDSSTGSSNSKLYESIVESIMPFEQNILEEKAIQKCKANDSIDFEYSIYETNNSEINDITFDFVNIKVSVELQMHVIFTLFTYIQSEVEEPCLNTSSISLAHAVSDQKGVAKSVFLTVIFTLDLFDDKKLSMKKFQNLYDMQMCDQHGGREAKFKSRMNYSDFVVIFTRVAVYSDYSSFDNRDACLNSLLHRLSGKIEVLRSNMSTFVKIAKNYLPITQNTGLYTRVSAYQNELYLAFNRSKNYGLNAYNEKKTESKQRSPIISRINKKYTPMQSDFATSFECFCHNHKISDSLVPSYTIKRISQFASKLCDDDRGLRYFITCFSYLILVIHGNSPENSAGGIIGVVDDIYVRVKNTFYE